MLLSIFIMTTPALIKPFSNHDNTTIFCDSRLVDTRERLEHQCEIFIYLFGFDYFMILTLAFLIQDIDLLTHFVPETGPGVGKAITSVRGVTIPTTSINTFIFP